MAVAGVDLTTIAKLKSFAGIVGGSDHDTPLHALITAVSRTINALCWRTLKSTTHTQKKYNGTGEQYLFLRDYPVTALTRLAIGKRSAVRITNTSTGTTTSVGVTSTGLVLTKDGSSDTSVTFAGYATLTLLAAAVNALGSGWSAVVNNADFASFQSSEVLEAFGQSCIDTQYAYLSIPDKAEGEFELDADSGELFLSSGFPRGTGNIIVDSIAGYLAGTHDDELAHLEHLCNRVCGYFWSKRGREGLSSMSRGGYGESIPTDVNMRELPADILMDLAQFQRIPT